MYRGDLRDFDKSYGEFPRFEEKKKEKQQREEEKKPSSS